MPPITLLDGPLGTELLRRGVRLPPGAWSAEAIEHAPGMIEAIHRDYAHAGATVHTACTFRAQPGIDERRYEKLCARAVALARGAIGPGHLVAGSMAPIGDCYRPDQSPLEVGPAGIERATDLHTRLARALVRTGCDVLLCESFPHAGEALLAARCALSECGGRPVWLSLTPGVRGELLTPTQLAHAAREAIGLGVGAVLVNCVSAELAEPYVRTLADSCAGTTARAGVYANAGDAQHGLGWGERTEDPGATQRYGELAASWTHAGATILGGCCGTGPGHIAELARRFT